jgi:hypothetical protein
MGSDELRFTIQNVGWSALHPIKASEARKAMQEYRKRNPACEITGSLNNVQIHHIIPVWADPSLAADPDNFIALSASAHVHIIFGHNGNFGKYYVKNIKDIAKRIQYIKSQSEIIQRPEPIIIQGQRRWWDSIIAIFLKGFSKS